MSLAHQRPKKTQCINIYLDELTVDIEDGHLHRYVPCHLPNADGDDVDGDDPAEIPIAQDARPALLRPANQACRQR